MAFLRGKGDGRPMVRHRALFAGFQAIRAVFHGNWPVKKVISAFTEEW